MGSINDNHTHRTHRRRRVGAALTVCGALVVSACGGGGDDSATAAPDTASGAESTAEMSGAAAEGGGSLAIGDSGDAPAADRATDPGAFDIGVIGRDVIIEMKVVLSSDDIQRTVASIMASASSLGGGVASSDVNYGDSGSDGYAVITVKVPPQSVDRLIQGLDDTAEVQSISQSAQDVTDQLVNLGVRIQNARQSVTNVREFMNRTENLNELVTLEAELTRRQTELEQLEAQQRNITDRVALSTVTIEVIPTATVSEPVVAEDETIGDAFRSGWDAFATMLFGIGFVLAATLPFIVSGLLIALIGWLVVRRRTADRPAPATARSMTPPPVPSDDTAISEPDREPDREPEPAS
jgi:hypothetical protein